MEQGEEQSLKNTEVNVQLKLTLCSFVHLALRTTFFLSNCSSEIMQNLDNLAIASKNLNMKVHAEKKQKNQKLSEKNSRHKSASILLLFSLEQQPGVLCS